jgi:DNA-binding response OmpR family regulator
MRRRILVVDDDVSICRALQLGLSSKEIEVDVAYDGESGIELGTQNRYDVVIADLILTGTSGIEVIKRIRKIFPDVVSILITANPEENARTESIRCGVSAYLEKPVSMKDMKEVIDRGFKAQAFKRNPGWASNNGNPVNHVSLAHAQSLINSWKQR